MRYLSDEWLDAANKALAALAPLPADVVIGYIVTVASGEDRRYSVRLGPTTPGVHQGVQDAGVTLRVHWELAVQIATGKASAQRAFLDGKLVLGGDVGLLLGHQKRLAQVDDLLGPVRAGTTF